MLYNLSWIWLWKVFQQRRSPFLWICVSILLLKFWISHLSFLYPKLSFLNYFLLCKGNIGHFLFHMLPDFQISRDDVRHSSWYYECVLLLHQVVEKMADRGAIIVETIEMHTGGEPLRIITSGYPTLEGNTILDKRRYLKSNLDNLRKFLMFEPRGHYDQYGALLVEADHPEAHLAVIFMHNEGYSTMCGHAIIALGRFAVDYGYIKCK